MIADLNILSFKEIEKVNSIAENVRFTLIDNRSRLEYSISLCMSLYKEFISRMQRSGNPLKKDAKKLFPILQKDGTYENEQPWIKSPSFRLIVFIHGLNSSPLCWSRYIQELLKEDSSTSTFAPYVYKKGYCKLEKAARPIFKIVQDYAKQYPDNPIFLIGHSNGARIVQYIEDNLEAKNIRLISIAGPHFGSKLINWIKFLRLNLCLGISESMTKELAYNGKWVNEKLKQWQAKSMVKPDKVVKRIFFASADDLRIFPNESSFPKLPNSTYYLLSGESHVTIIDAVSKMVLREIVRSRL